MYMDPGDVGGTVAEVLPESSRKRVDLRYL